MIIVASFLLGIFFLAYRLVIDMECVALDVELANPDML